MGLKKILWFRRDLRVDDTMLLAQDGEVLPLFIFDTNILNTLEKDDKRMDFIYQAVLKLKESLCALGLDLAIFYGDPLAIFTSLKAEGFDEVYASVDYDDYARTRDAKVGKILAFHALNDAYIFEPAEVLKSNGTPYLVFTPYYHACKQLYTQFHALSYAQSPLQRLASYTIKPPPSLESMGFRSLHASYKEAYKKVACFKDKVADYPKHRDRMDLEGTSKLSMDLRFGTISIRHLLRTLSAWKKEGLATEPFFRQLIFRDFYAYLLYHFPKLQWENYKYSTPCHEDEKAYKAFCEARTGYPLIDAAITELLITGEMHNRARMVVGSFFTKHLMLPWQKGEAFFAKYLKDYEASSNILSWQWCAGTGIDPQPYFRIFNPYTQSKTYDKEAVYIKKHLPFLRDIPAKYLHDERYLLSHSIKDYPKPIIEHTKARARFLSSFC